MVYREVHEFLISLGFIQPKHDYCLYTRVVNRKLMIILIYVDDGFIAAESDDDLDEFKRLLFKRFKTNDVTKSNKFLGIELGWNGNTVSLSQSRYIEHILKRYKMSDYKPRRTPMETNLKIKENLDDSLITKKPYRELIGSLGYLASMTRPDILFAVNYLSQFQNRPTDEMYDYANRILRYLSGTINMKLVYGCTKISNLGVFGFADADFGSDINDRKSRSGYVFMLGEKLINNVVVDGDLISWASVKQKSVSLSTSEAEFVALSTAVLEGLWIVNMVGDIGVNRDTLHMYEDNKNAILSQI